MKSLLLERFKQWYSPVIKMKKAGGTKLLCFSNCHFFNFYLFYMMVYFRPFPLHLEGEFNFICILFHIYLAYILSLTILRFILKYMSSEEYCKFRNFSITSCRNRFKWGGVVMLCGW